MQDDAEDAMQIDESPQAPSHLPTEGQLVLQTDGLEEGEVVSSKAQTPTPSAGLLKCVDGNGEVSKITGPLSEYDALIKSMMAAPLPPIISTDASSTQPAHSQMLSDVSFIKVVAILCSQLTFVWRFVHYALCRMRNPLVTRLPFFSQTFRIPLNPIRPAEKRYRTV